MRTAPSPESTARAVVTRKDRERRRRLPLFALDERLLDAVAPVPTVAGVLEKREHCRALAAQWSAQRLEKQARNNAYWQAVCIEHLGVVPELPSMIVDRPGYHVGHYLKLMAQSTGLTTSAVYRRYHPDGPLPEPVPYVPKVYPIQAELPGTEEL